MNILLLFFLGFLGFAGNFLPALAQNDTPENGVAQSLPEVALHIGKATLNTEVASTGQEREIGLMYRNKMPDNDGMIFLMPNVAPVVFWMKNTLIPLSIAYIDKDGVILEIHDMLPEDFTRTHADRDLPTYPSESKEVAFALETNLHWFALNGIKPGDKLDPAPATLGPSKP